MSVRNFSSYVWSSYSHFLPITSNTDTEGVLRKLKQYLFHLILQIREVAKEEGIFAKDEFRTMLQFYHDLGVIVYYGGLGTLDNTLRNTVILKPQWLVDMFKRIITVRDLEHQVAFHY